MHKQLKQTNADRLIAINVLGLTAALAAYRDGQEWLDQVIACLEDNQDYLFEAVYS